MEGLLASLWLIIYGIVGALSVYFTQKYLSDEVQISSREYVIAIAVFLGLGFIVGHFSSFSFILSTVLCWLLVIAYVDVKIHSIYHWMLGIASGINIAAGLILKNAFSDLILGAIVGIAIYGLIYGGAYLYYKREAFGFGDVLLMGSLGLFFGLQKTAMIAILSFYIALIGIVILALIGKKLNRSIEIAFAPYMILSAITVALFDRQIIELYRSIFMI